MKRNKIILALLLLSLVLTSCSKADNSINTSKDNIVQEEQVVNENNEAQEDKQNLEDNEQDDTPSKENNTELPAPQVDKVYDVVDKKYDNYGLHITYPQITNISDKNKQNKTNEMIKSEALIVLDFYRKSDGTLDIENANFDVNYKITFESKDVLSLKFYGLENDKGLNHPIDCLYTLNIDMNNCSKLKLSDFININEKFVDNFKKYRISEPGHNGIGDRVFNLFINDNLMGTSKYLMECFNASDSSYKNTPRTFSYYTKDYLVISTEIQHSVGDYLEIKLKYKDIKDNIKSDNEIWEDILNSNK